MLDSEKINHLYEYFLLNNIQLSIRGVKRLPTCDELKVIIEDCIAAVREHPESISIEIGSLLVKRTDARVDVYVHVGDVSYHE